VALIVDALLGCAGGRLQCQERDTPCENCHEVSCGLDAVSGLRHYIGWT